MSTLKLALVGLATLGLTGVLVSMQMATAQITTQPTGGGAQVLSCPAGWERVPASQGYTCRTNFNAGCDTGKFVGAPTIAKIGSGPTWRVAYDCTSPG